MIPEFTGFIAEYNLVRIRIIIVNGRKVNNYVSGIITRKPKNIAYEQKHIIRTISSIHM